MHLRKYFRAVLTLVLGLLLAACQSTPSAVQPAATLNTSVSTPAIVPTPESTLAWITTDKSAQRIIYFCSERRGFADQMTLCSIGVNNADGHVLIHNLDSNVLLTNDGQWIIFGELTIGERGSSSALYRLHVADEKIQQLTQDQRFLAYILDKIEDNWVYFRVWTGEGKIYISYRASLLTGDVFQILDF